MFFYLHVLYLKNWGCDEKITGKNANDVRSWKGNEEGVRNNGGAAGVIQKISRTGKIRTSLEQVKSEHL